MDQKSKDAYLGILTAAGIYHIVSLMVFNLISVLNIYDLADIQNSLMNKALFELLPFLIISLLFISRLLPGKTFSLYYKITTGIIIVGEIVLSIAFFGYY